MQVNGIHDAVKRRNDNVTTEQNGYDEEKMIHSVKPCRFYFSGDFPTPPLESDPPSDPCGQYERGAAKFRVNRLEKTIPTSEGDSYSHDQRTDDETNDRTGHSREKKLQGVESDSYCSLDLFFNGSFRGITAWNGRGIRILK